MNKPVIEIVHFSDVLCIWAYIAQIRVEELQASFPTEVRIDYRFMQVFGNVADKMDSQWADRGGLEGYAEHVRGVAAQFEHVKINPQVWLANTPTSSLPAHLLLCGVKALRAAGSGWRRTGPRPARAPLFARRVLRRAHRYLEPSEAARGR
jgi:hypothetical protein